MPRTTRKSPAPAPVESRPFADDSSAPFGALAPDEQKAIAAAIAADKAAGLSGNELRAKYGARLSGPARRKLLRAYGFEGTAYIARSYEAYRDGDARNGSRHAREHGAAAASRRAQAAQEAAQAAPLAEVRKAVRASGAKPAAVRKGDETALRAQYAALLLAS
jgi:hypothetical protein